MLQANRGSPVTDTNDLHRMTNTLDANHELDVGTRAAAGSAAGRAGP